MKKFDLTTLKIHNLSKSELVELDNYLNTINYREIIAFFIKIMDESNPYDDTNYKKIENFIKKSIHVNLIRGFHLATNNMLIEEYTEEDWLALEKKTKVIRDYLHKENTRKRKEKLNKINQL